MNEAHQGRGRADLSNWRTPPFSTWSFRHVRELIASADIACAPDGGPTLPGEPHSLDSFRVQPAGRPAQNLDQFLHTTATDSLVVLWGGRRVYEFYAPGMDVSTPHIVMSASKSIVGLVAGILRHDGLDVDAPVRAFVPEVARTAYRGATLRHLLDMRAGVVFDDEELRAYRAAGNWDPTAPAQQAAGLHSFFETTAGTFTAHGGPFRYVSAHTDLLGWALERATGQPFAALIRDRLWQPMGAEHDAYVTLDRVGAPRCTGGLCSTTRDLARIGQLVLDDGHVGGQQVVPADWIDDIASRGDAQAWQRGEFAGGFPGVAMHYRSGWYVVVDEPRTLFAMGIHGQHLFIDRTHRLVVAKLSAQAHAIDYQAIALTMRAVAEIRRCLVGNAGA